MTKSTRIVFIVLVALCLLACFHGLSGYAQYAVAPVPKMQFFNNQGQVLAGGKITTFAAGTSTPQSTFADNAGTPNANPITLDSQGRATIYLNNLCFKFQVQDASLSTIYTQDNVCIPGLATTSITVGSGQTFRLQVGAITDLAANLLPHADATYNLGSNVLRWNNIFGVTGAFTQANIAGHLAFITGASAPEIDCSALGAFCQILGSSTGSGNIVLTPGSVAGFASVVVNGVRTDQPAMIFTQQLNTTSDILQVRDNANTVQIRFTGSNGTNFGHSCLNCIVSNNIEPLANLLYNIGSPLAYWENLYTDIVNAKSSVNLGSNAYLNYPTGAGAVASAGTITPTGPMFHVSGTSAIATINLPATFGMGCLDIIPDGAFTTTAAGNIALASTAVVNRELRMCYDFGTSKWYPSY